MSGTAPRGFPAIPYVHRFLELNVRTYVTCEGKPGVWFFSLDAESRLAVRARTREFSFAIHGRTHVDDERRNGHRRLSQRTYSSR